MDPVKLAGIADWPAPSTLRQLQSFLGFGNFYRKFIHHYSDLTHPFNELLQKIKVTIGLLLDNLLLIN